VIEGVNDRQESYVKRSIQTDSVISIAELKREYLKLAADPSMVYLYPHAEYDRDDSLFILHLRIIPEAPLEARFGPFYSTTGIAENFLGISYRTISEVSTHAKGSIQFGRLYDGINLGLRFDYPTRTPVFFSGNFNYNRFDYNITNPNFFFEDLKPSYIIENEINFRFEAGIPTSINGILKGGIGIGRNRESYYLSRDFTSQDTSDISVVNLVSVYSALESNTLNDKQSATEGRFRRVSVRAGYGLESYKPGSTAIRLNRQKMNYYWLTLKYEHTGYFPVKGKFSLGYHFTAHAAIKPLLSNFISSIIEAPAFQPNLITKSLFMQPYRANQFLAAGIIPVFRLGEQVHAKLEAYGFFPVQEILARQDQSPYMGNYFRRAKTIFNGSVNLNTVAGPIGLHAGYISELGNPWVVQLSFGYLFFNKRSTDD